MSANQCLRKSMIFGGRDPNFLWQLSSMMELETFETGVNLITEGEEGYNMYLISSGVAEVLVGKEQRQVAVLEAGSAFGEQALLGDARRSSTVRALSSGEVFVISQRYFSGLLKKFPEERSHFGAMARERRQTAAQLNDQHLKPGERRISTNTWTGSAGPSRQCSRPSSARASITGSINKWTSGQAAPERVIPAARTASKDAPQGWVIKAQMCPGSTPESQLRLSTMGQVLISRMHAERSRGASAPRHARPATAQPPKTARNAAAMRPFRSAP